MRITGIRTHDLRFPTSVDLAGSDAMHPDPDYSAAYVVLETDGDHEGHGFTFTIGRGNEICVAAIDALAHHLVDVDVDDLPERLGPLARALTGDPQLRWLGPEKGVIHLAAAALVNALWDLHARIVGKPVWKVLVDLEPEALVDLVDWRHLTDTLTPGEALEILEEAAPGRRERERRHLALGLPAYTTSAGWLGYPDDRIVRLARRAVARGFRHIKLKVGADPADDHRRVRLVREAVGPDVRIAVDANQRWEVDEAIANIRALEPLDLAWIEEPTSPDDILGHRRISRAVDVPVAGGEHGHNRIMFKQFLAAGALDVCQIDACRVAGVNENIAIMLLAAKFDVPVVPHAGGVGLCELVPHLAMFDAVAVGGDDPRRVVEFADHLHHHFVHPARIENGNYVVPTAPGYSAEMHPATLTDFAFPDGPAWSSS